jgi:NTP pyrophosphohydrolases including oxidative damage repair enzymes
VAVVEPELPLNDAAKLRALIFERLRGTAPHSDLESAANASTVNALVRQALPATPAAAAVLVPIVDRESGLTVLLTRRASHLRHHAGQISFPGGRIEPTDEGPYQAALREAHEEIGLTAEHVSLAGYLDPLLVVSGYWVTPVVGLVQPGFALRLDTREVESTFEVPLAHVLEPANHHARERSFGATSLRVYDIPFGPYNIWGATAAMLIALYRVLSAARS